MRYAKVVDAYLDTALWASHDDAGDPLDRNYSIADVAPCARRQLARELAAFVRQNVRTLQLADEYGYPKRQAGGPYLARVAQDLWLTQNGHGAGFWDGDWGPFGNALTRAAKRAGARDLYVGEDGLLYVSPARG